MTNAAPQLAPAPARRARVTASDLADRGRAGTLPKDPEDEAVPTTPTRRGLSLLDVTAQWKTEGALERITTGWSSFDRMTRGGFVLGRLAFVLGAPNASKTAALACLAWRWAHEGVAVGALAVDEDVSDLVTRFAVMSGVSLDDAEARSPKTLKAIEASLGELPIRLYGPEWTIEGAAADLHAWMQSRGIKRGVFLADSLQTIECVASRGAGPGAGLRVSVGQNVKALSGVAARYRLAVIASGEIPRSHYDGRRTDDMAATKESGAGEYAVKVQLVLRRVKKHDSLVHVSCPKIKRGLQDEGAFFLRFDRATHSLTEDDGSTGATDEATAASVRARIVAVTASRDGLKSAHQIAKAVGGRRQPVFAEAKRMIDAGELQLVAGTYRQAAPEATA